MRHSAGFLIINKPAGPTSHDIIDRLRQITNIYKIGHAGTLDPFASGVLLVAVGREATKKIIRFVKLDKKYIAVLHLGATTDTYDKAGKITGRFHSTIVPDSRKIKSVLSALAGRQKQIPPMYSAKKIGGKKLYKLARAGIEIERKPATIKIYHLQLLFYKWPLLKTYIHCSSGTYIRSLAHDIGQMLGCGAYLKKLERIAVGKNSIKNAIVIKNLNKNNWTRHLIPIT